MVFPVSLVYAFLSDLKSLTIPNGVSIALTISFVAAAVLAGLPFLTILAHFGLGFIVLAVGLLVFALGYAGGGDIKLLSAVSIWIGWQTMLPFLLFVGLFGGLLSLVILALRLRGLGMYLSATGWTRRFAAEDVILGNKVPYGLAISAAALVLMTRLSTYPFSGM